MVPTCPCYPLAMISEIKNKHTNVTTRQSFDVIFSFRTASSVSCRRRIFPSADLGSFSMKVTPPRSLLYGATLSANQSSFKLYFTTNKQLG